MERVGLRGTLADFMLKFGRIHGLVCFAEDGGMDSIWSNGVQDWFNVIRDY